MVVGVGTWDLHLAGCGSLKDKRRILKSLKDRLHHRFNVSVAETGHHEQWQRAELSVCVISGDRRHAESVLSSAAEHIGRDPLARIIDSQTSLL